MNHLAVISFCLVLLISEHWILSTEYCSANPWHNLKEGDQTAEELLKKVEQSEAHPFYQGLEQTYTESELAQRSQALSQTDPASQMVHESSETRPQFKIDSTHDPLITEAQKIMTHPLEEVGGKGTHAVSEVHSGINETIVCEEAGEEAFETCKNTLYVNVMKVKVPQDTLRTIRLTGCKKSHKSNHPRSCPALLYGLLHQTSPLTAAFKACLEEDQTTNRCEKCGSPRATLPRDINKDTITHVDLALSNAGAPLIQTSTRYSRHGRLKNYDITATLKLTTEKEEPKVLPDEWTSTCTRLEEKSDIGLCHYVSKVCTQGPQTRTIKGVPITRDCWELTYTYRCAYPSKNDCRPLRARGCAQIASTCKQRVGKACVVYQQTYQCKGGPQTIHSIIGGNTPFCLDGNCRDQSYEVNDEMMSTLAQLSILKELEGQLKAGSFFKGESNKCSKQVLSFKDCCGSGKGWGKDMRFAHCSSSEKLLNERRVKGLCHFVGTYCAKKVLGKCVTKKSTYCCFGSKLLRIFHEQGRPQIGLGWGNPKHPQCRGFTLEEIQRIDFSKLDLREVFEDLMKTYSPEKLKGTGETLKSRIEAIQKNLRPPMKKQVPQRTEA